MHAVRLATDKETIATAMTADKTFPQLSQEIRYVNLFATEMAKYVDAADSDCTMFAPDNTVRTPAKPARLLLQLEDNAAVYACR